MQKIYSIPHNYSDTFSVELATKMYLPPRVVVEKLFTQTPTWIGILFKLRNIIVKPFGLKGSKESDSTLDYKAIINSMIIEEHEEEIIFGADDKHLNFHVSLHCSEIINEKQTVALTTIVKYHNLLGKVYFFFVKPFHVLIVKSMLKNLAS